MPAARQEKSLTALCQEFGISRPTGYLWQRRFQQAGIAGIAEHSRRPQQSPCQTVPELEQRVVEIRQRYPDWGARKLQGLLARAGVELKRSTIHRILLRHDLVREGDRHTPAVERFERATPNELWQMDFKSPKGWNAAAGPLSVLDDHSRYLLVLQAVWSTRAELVREQLESAFLSCGVPAAMLMDHHYRAIGVLDFPNEMRYKATSSFSQPFLLLRMLRLSVRPPSGVGIRLEKKCRPVRGFKVFREAPQTTMCGSSYASALDALTALTSCLLSTC